MRAGEVVGLGGLVGSGRSELLGLIYGTEIPDEGEVLVDGEAAPRPAAPAAAIKAGLGLAPEDRKSQGLVLDWSLDQERQPLRPRAASAASACSTSAAERRRGPRPSCARCKTVPDDVDRVARLLSGGNQQKVVLARWLLRHCRVLLLDEPTRGVDVPTKAEIYRLITDLAKAGPRACSSSRPSSRSSSASARASSSCARARSWPRSTARRPPSRSCCGTPSRPIDAPVLAEEVE